MLLPRASFWNAQRISAFVLCLGENVVVLHIMATNINNQSFIQLLRI